MIDAAKKGWRKEVMKRYPRVTYLVKARACTGWNFNKRRPCKNMAHWKFRARVKRTWLGDSESGTYCWSHLISRGIFTNDEHDKWLGWWEAFTKKNVINLPTPSEEDHAQTV